MKLGWQERWIGKADEWIYGWTDRHTHIKRERDSTVCRECIREIYLQ